MALDVQCGCASKIEIVRTNSLTGEVTGVFPQTNIWTDAGLARISGYATGGKGAGAEWPERLRYGSGTHVTPHGGVTALASEVGVAGWGGTSVATYPDLDTVLVTRTASITVAARGVAWELSELGLCRQWYDTLDTYSLTKIDGVPAPIPVAAIEILTITYTVQIQYPRRLPPQPMPFENGPETYATFTIPGTDAAAFRTAIRGTLNHGQTNFCLFTSSAFAGGVAPTSVVAGASVFSNAVANRANTHAGQNDLKNSRHLWTFDPPITKTNTQELTITSHWTFTNGTYREV